MNNTSTSVEESIKPLNDQETSLNYLIELIVTAHKRGALTLEESAKAWEAIKIFMPSKQFEQVSSLE